MDKVTLLCHLQQFMLEAFQQRTLAAFRRQRLTRLMLSPMQPLLALQITGQIDKGQHIVEHAASLVRAGTYPTGQDTQRLLTMSRHMDQVFIARDIIPSTRLANQLPLIEPIRMHYIQFLLNETHQLLRQLQGGSSLRQALACQYDVPQCSKLLYDMLHSIGLETRLLAQVANIPVLVRPMRETISQTIYLAMDGVARVLADDSAHRLFRGRT